MPTKTEMHAQSTAALKVARDIVDAATKAGREHLTLTEQSTVESKMDEARTLNAAIKGRVLVESVRNLGSAADEDNSDGAGQRFMSLRRGGTKSKVATRASDNLNGKALSGTPLVGIELDPNPYLLGRTATSLLEILPTVVRAPAFRWMQQTTRTNLAATVAVGGLKPTSIYGLMPVDGRLKVIAHISEPIDVYQLKDTATLMAFVANEMAEGLHAAVEQQIVSGTGVGGNLNGLASTSGIQTVTYATSQVLTARAAVTAAETAGHAPSSYVMNPVDWAGIETSTLDVGQYVLNAEGNGNVPIEAATRRLWGIPVAVSMAVPVGTGWLISDGCVQIATDGAVAQEWSAGVADDFARNSVRCRVETRAELLVTRPAGVVKIDLTA